MPNHRMITQSLLTAIKDRQERNLAADRVRGQEAQTDLMEAMFRYIVNTDDRIKALEREGMEGRG